MSETLKVSRCRLVGPEGATTGKDDDSDRPSHWGSPVRVQWRAPVRRPPTGVNGAVLGHPFGKATYRTFHRRIVTLDGTGFVGYEQEPCVECMASINIRHSLSSSSRSGKGCMCRVITVDGKLVPAPARA